MARDICYVLTILVCVRFLGQYSILPVQQIASRNLRLRIRFFRAPAASSNEQF